MATETLRDGEVGVEKKQGREGEKKTVDTSTSSSYLSLVELLVTFYSFQFFLSSKAVPSCG